MVVYSSHCLRTPNDYRCRHRYRTMASFATSLFPRHLAKEERVKIFQFSDKLLRVAELRATPMPLMVAMIAKDLLREKRVHTSRESSLTRPR